VRRNRLAALGAERTQSYADEEAVKREIAYARRMFADNDWPVIDVTRRSIEETAAAVIRLCEDRREAQAKGTENA
jgi:regulator of PEP synthase PpsR (kinase-PPPase family)